MTKTLVSSALALATVVALSPSAFADGATAGGGAGAVAGTIGVGVEDQIHGSVAGIGDLSVNYDTGVFHVGAFFGFYDPTNPNNTAFEVGARFFYHIHHTANADFSVGGSIGIGSVETADAAGGSTSATAVYLEPSFQIRWFVASNVALSFTGGFSIGLDDDKTFQIGGQLSGLAGIHYYFSK